MNVVLCQVFLDPKERNNTEYKLETFSGVYRKLTGKDVVFEYPITEAWKGWLSSAFVFWHSYFILELL